MRTGGEQEERAGRDGGATIAESDDRSGRRRAPAVVVDRPRRNRPGRAWKLRPWGSRWGLPFGYNLDERSALRPAGGPSTSAARRRDADYQLNPSGLIE